MKEKMDEHQQNWKEMANTMMKINKKVEEMFNIVHVMDQDELEPTWHLLHSSGNMHSFTHNQDLVSPALLAGWIKFIGKIDVATLLFTDNIDFFLKTDVDEKKTTSVFIKTNINVDTLMSIVSTLINNLMQSYPARALDRRLQVDWARDPREGPRVLISLRLKDPASIESPQASFHQVVIRAQELQFLLPFVFKPPTRKNHNLGTNMSHHSSSGNGKGTSHKDPLSRILDEFSSLKLWKEKQERKEKRKKRVEEISQDERKKIREEERRKIMKEMKREKHASYSSHNSCKSLSGELRDYYEGRRRSHLRPHSHRREKERKSQEANINLSYFHGKDNVEANLVWEIRVEQQLKKKSTSKSYGSHSYPKKYQGQGILGVTPSKPKDDKGKTIKKQAPKASMQEKTSSINSQDKATTSPSSSESEKAKREESSEEIYPQEEGQPLVVKEKCKEVSVSSKRLAKKETHFTIKTNIKETFPLRQPPHFLFCKKTLASIATPLGVEFIPQVKKLLDEGLVRKSLNPCALLVPKIGIIRHQVPKIGGMMNVLSGATLFCKITRAPNIFMVCVHRDLLGSFNTNLGTHMRHLSNQGVPMNPKRIKVIPEWHTPPSEDHLGLDPDIEEEA
ncbi:hypothetical protein HKD37_07G019669 [Glycine soja]